METEPVYQHRQRPDISLEADTSVSSNTSHCGGEESKKRKIGGFTRSTSVSRIRHMELTIAGGRFGSSSGAKSCRDPCSPRAV